jgi:mono/diheme cytochrome c family protein
MRRAIAWCAAAVAVVGCSSPSDGDVAPREVLEQGQAVYQAHCASCHGAEGEGQPDWKSPGPDGVYPAPPHDSSGHTWHHADADLIEIIQRGGQAVYGSASLRSGMPPFGDVLTDQEIVAVLALIKTFWDEEERAYQEQLNR